MATFSYVARDSNGRRVTGTLAGASERAVLSELDARSLAPVEVRPVRERRSRRRVPARTLATTYVQIADLLRAGVPLLRALRLVGRRRSNPRLAAVMTEIAEAVSEGERLADAMRERSDVFPPIHVAMVRAGEQGGFLEEVLARLGAFLEHQADMRSKVLGNLIYPFVLLGMAVLIVVGVLVLLVPKFQTLLDRVEIGWSTKLLLGLSDVLRERWGLVLVGVVVLTLLVRWAWGRAEVRAALLRWQLRVPKVGELVRALSTARFTRILGTMLDNGIPMLTAMQISREAAGHPVMERAIEEATEAVRSGESLARPLAESRMFDEDVIEMIAVGESANNLPEVLVTIADTIERRVDRMLGVLLRLMEPALLLMLAGVVMFIFIALALPMMKMSTALQ